MVVVVVMRLLQTTGKSVTAIQVDTHFVVLRVVVAWYLISSVASDERIVMIWKMSRFTAVVPGSSAAAVEGTFTHLRTALHASTVLSFRLSGLVCVGLFVGERK